MQGDVRKRFLSVALVVTAILALSLPASPAHAAGVVSVCDESHLLSALSGGGTVTFTCSGTIILTSTITIAADTTIDGSGQAVTISGNHAVRVFTVNAGVALSLKGLTVADGFVTLGSGAGIRNAGGMVSASQTTFSGHSASNDGGAIYNDGGTVDVSNSTFAANSAGSNGGAIYGDDGTLTVASSSFLSNSSDNGGGGIYSSGDSVTISGSSFTGNTASSFGGALASVEGSLLVSDSDFADGSGSFGGAIYNYATATVSKSTFSGNDSNKGGAIYSLGSLTVSSSTFSTNNSVANGIGRGGGVSNEGGTLTVANSTFTGNSSDLGGALSNEDGSLTATNTSLSGNSATAHGGGIYAFGTGATVLKNTIVARSPAGGNCYGTITDGSGNLSYPDTTCPGINQNPLLGPLQDNGGPTLTMAPGPGSPAIDAAVDAICAADPVNGLDQRGVTRPQGWHCDIGAVEQELYTLPRPWPIDIKPGSDPNSINCRNVKEVIAVAILTTDTLDATTIDHATVVFEGATETHVNKKTGEPTRHVEDVDGDGDMDLVLHFRLGDTRLTCGSMEAMLVGMTFDGKPITGADYVRMVGGG